MAYSHIIFHTPSHTDTFGSMEFVYVCNRVHYIYICICIYTNTYIFTYLRIYRYICSCGSCVSEMIIISSDYSPNSGDIIAGEPRVLRVCLQKPDTTHMGMTQAIINTLKLVGFSHEMISLQRLWSPPATR